MGSRRTPVSILPIYETAVGMPTSERLCTWGLGTCRLLDGVTDAEAAERIERYERYMDYVNEVQDVIELYADYQAAWPSADYYARHLTVLEHAPGRLGLGDVPVRMVAREAKRVHAEGMPERAVSRIAEMVDRLGEVSELREGARMVSFKWEADEAWPLEGAEGPHLVWLRVAPTAGAEAEVTVIAHFDQSR